MKKRRAIYILCLLFLLLVPATAHAKWKDTAKGRIYTTSGKPGYYTGWHTIGGAKYFFKKSNGVMYTGWKKVNKKQYYFGDDGKMRTKWQTIDDQVYYFGTDGVCRTGWQTIKVAKKPYRFYFNEKGQRISNQIVTIKNNSYYFGTNGRLNYGYITFNGKKYYADLKTGVLAKEKWIDKVYYFKSDCTMAVNEWAEGRWFDANGRFTGVTNLVGFIREDGRTYYYDSNHKKVTGWLNTGGKSYYLTPAVTTGWFKADGETYLANENGVIQKSVWNGKKYLTSSGAMAVGWATIGGHKYYFKDNGNRVTGHKTINGASYVFTKKGVLRTNTWIKYKKKKYYVGDDGAKYKGIAKIDGKYYFFNTKTCELKTGWCSANGKRYYADKKTGVIAVNTWFKPGKYKFYATADGSVATGLHTIKGKKYFFRPKGRLLTKKKQTVGNDTYFFGANGAAVVKKWKKISGKYYYFGANGVMAKNTVVDGYQIGPDGARIGKAKGGWVTQDGEKYYYVGGKAVTGWQTISGSDYYFDDKGVMQTGLQTIGSKKYYFYSSGILAKGLTLAVGNKEYTINAKGVVTEEKTIQITGNHKGAQIAKFAVKYVGNRYVYGGTSLTNGADCSGFVQTVFANFGIKLLRVANDQMYGPSQAYINSGYKAAVVVSEKNMLPGDLIFYGSGSYASHVAIYIGNGNIVHASNSQPYPAGGIKISPYNYSTPIRIVRYWS